MNRNVSEPLPGPRQTNQRAELLALSRALDLAPRNRNIVIVSDSKYAINCVTEWYPNWQRNGWKNAAGKSVENRDLVEQVLAKVEERTKSSSSSTSSSSPSCAIAEVLAAANGDGGIAAAGGGCGVRTEFEWVKGHAADVGNQEADRLAVEGAKAGQQATVFSS